MRIEDLLIWPGRKSLGGQPESDALREEDALLEAALVDVRIDAINSTAWLLFDLKGAINLEIGNTAVVAVHGVTDLQWESDPKGGQIVVFGHVLDAGGGAGNVRHQGPDALWSTVAGAWKGGGVLCR